MASSIGGRLKHAWNAFVNPTTQKPRDSIGVSYGIPPSRSRTGYSHDGSIITAIRLKIAIDCASIAIRHVRTDDNERYLEPIKSLLNDCLTLDSNIDQTGQAFRIDLFMTMMEEGFLAIVPVDTTDSPVHSNAFDIKTLRIGRIIEWMPEHVRVNVYDQRDGLRKDLVLSKKFVAVVENPLYEVMNKPNSTLQRLIRKLSLLDGVDEATSSGKLDLIIQLPYVVKSETRRLQAERRGKDIEMQLKGSKYGIAYIDGTERVTQLNRPAENNLLSQIETLHAHLYHQLGITESVFDGTADEKTMLNYQNRTIMPILTAVTESMKRTFLTKTARTRNQSIMYFRDPFKLVSVADIAEIADKFSRNEIMSSNEIRQIVGLRPSDDPKAEELRNSNMPAPSEEEPGVKPANEQPEGALPDEV